MVNFYRAISSFTVWATVLVTISCSTQKQLTKVGDGTGTKSGIPDEIVEKFEVKELGGATVAEPSPTPSPALSKKEKKKKEKISAKKAASKKSKARASEETKPPSDHYDASGIKESELVSAPGISEAGYPKRKPAVEPIWIGEKLSYEVTYLGAPCGTFTTEVLPFKVINGRKVFHIKGTALSSRMLEFLARYKLQDSLETFFDYEGRFSHRFHLVLDETKQNRDSLELYDSEKKQAYFWDRLNHYKRGFEEKKETHPMLPFSQDSVSSLFFVRGMTLKDGEVLSFPVVTDGKTWELEVTVVRHELLRTVLGTIKTVVLRPVTKFQGVLKQAGDSYLWVTDDARRLMVRMEAKVKIGYVVAALKEANLGTPP